MKKIFTKFLVLFACILFAPNVFASDLREDLTLEKDSTECYVVKSGSNVTIDLNNHNITCANSDAIYVENGATLTVEGKGTVQTTTAKKTALFNNGTVVLNGGTFTADDSKTQYYSILNHGMMTINEGVTVSQTNYTTASLIDNGYYDYGTDEDRAAGKVNERIGYVEGKGIAEPTLIINGGVFEGGMNTIKNDDSSNLEINDGYFINNVQVAVFNVNKAVINGGVFEVLNGNDKTALYLASYGKDSVDKGILEINGGTFNGEYVVELNNNKYIGDTKLTITDGIFNSKVAFTNTTGRPTLDKVGSLSITGGVFTDSNITPDEGYNLIQIDKDYNEDGIKDVLVSEVQLLPAIEVNLKVDETYDTEVSNDIVKYGTWTTTDESIASVKDGIITAHSKGTATIKVKFGSETKTYDVTVTRIQLEKPTVDGKYIYNGESQEVKLIGYDEKLMSLTNNTATNANKYTTTVTLKNTVKYEWTDAKTEEVTLEWNIEKAKVELPTLEKDSYLYTAESITPSVNGYDEKLMVASGDKTAILVGQYKLIYSLVDTNNYEWVDDKTEEVTLEWNIEKAKVELPTLEKENYEYTTKSITPNVKGYDEKLMNVSGDTEGVNPGKYILVYTLKDTDNYEWVDSKTEEVKLVWNINKGLLEKPTLVSETYPYTGGEVTPEFENLNEALMTVDGIKVGSPVGKYTVTISLKDKDNYTWDDGTTEDIGLVWTISFGIPELTLTSTYNSIKLTWNEIDGAEGYQLYRCNSKGGSCTRLTTTTKLTFTDKKRSFNKTYYYKVRAYRLDDESKIYGKYSKLVSKKTALTRADITVSTNRYRNVLVEWDKVSGATRYYVYRCDVDGNDCKKLGFANDTDFVNTNAKEGVEYTYKVRPYRSGVYGPYSEAVLGVRLEDSISYSVKNTSYRTNTITIKNVETAKKYYIYRATSKNGTYKKIKTLSTTGETLVFNDTNVSFNKTYYYRVKINNGVNDSDYSSKKSVTTNVIAAPNINVETSGLYVTISMDEVDGATGYQILYSTDSKTFKTLTKTSETSYDKKLSENKYFVKVRAYRKVGKKYYYSKYSEVQEFNITK